MIITACMLQMSCIVATYTHYFCFVTVITKLLICILFICACHEQIKIVTEWVTRLYLLYVIHTDLELAMDILIGFANYLLSHLDYTFWLFSISDLQLLTLHTIVCVHILRANM